MQLYSVIQYDIMDYKIYNSTLKRVIGAPCEALRRRGYTALRARLPAAELQFPRRPNGSPLLLKEGLYERLISQKTPEARVEARVAHSTVTVLITICIHI